MEQRSTAIPVPRQSRLKGSSALLVTDRSIDLFASLAGHIDRNYSLLIACPPCRVNACERRKVGDREILGRGINLRVHLIIKYYTRLS